MKNDELHFKWVASLMAPYQSIGEELASRHDPIETIRNTLMNEVGKTSVTQVASRLTGVMYAMIYARIKKALSTVGNIEDVNAIFRAAGVPALDRAFSGNLTSARVQSGVDMVPTVATMLLAIINFKNHGSRIYSTSPGLGDRLRHTEVVGLNSEDIRLPFPCIYIIFPKSAQLNIYDAAGGSFPCVGAYMQENNIKGRNILMTFVSYNAELDDFNSLSFLVPLAAHKKLDDVVRAISEQYMLASAGLLERGVDPKVVQNIADSWQPLFKFALNVVLYATSSDVELEGIYLDDAAQREWDKIKKLPPDSPQRKKRKKQLDEMKAPRAIYLGRSCKLWTKEMREAALTGRTVGVQSLVAGHYKKQFHGPLRALRKRIFIEPYWRGPEDGPVIAPEHKLHGLGLW